MARNEAIGQIIQLHQRFEAARRMARLMGAFAGSVLPRLPNLPAMVDINWASYQHILAACPGLLPVLPSSLLANLPGFKQLEQIRQRYEAAISAALNKLEQLPLGMIDKLERELNRKIDRLLAAIGPALSYLECACAIADEISNPNEADVARAKSMWTELSAKPSILDTSGQRQMVIWQEQKSTLQQILKP